MSEPVGKMPVDECLTAGCNVQGPDGSCSRCGYPGDDESPGPWGDLLARADYLSTYREQSLPFADLLRKLAAALRSQIAETERLEIAVFGCGCPAPYTECPHDEPMMAATGRLTAQMAEARDELAKNKGVMKALCCQRDEAEDALTEALAAYTEPLWEGTTVQIGAGAGLPGVSHLVHPRLDVPPGTEVDVHRKGQMMQSHWPAPHEGRTVAMDADDPVWNAGVTRDQMWQAVAGELSCSCPENIETGQKPPTKDGSHLSNCPAGEVEFVVEAVMGLLAGDDD